MISLRSTLSSHSRLGVITCAMRPSAIAVVGAARDSRQIWCGRAVAGGKRVGHVHVVDVVVVLRAARLGKRRRADDDADNSVRRGGCSRELVLESGFAAAARPQLSNITIPIAVGIEPVLGIHVCSTYGMSFMPRPPLASLVSACGRCGPK